MDTDWRQRPLGVLLGACWIACLAAAVNTHFLLRIGISVSHLTGDLARLGMQLGTVDRWNSSEITMLAATLIGFVAGAAVAGYAIGNPNVSLERPYGRAVMAIGAVLLVAWWLQDPVPSGAAFLAAAGCGFQNSLATRYRGLVLRTTHVTGILTDVGHLIGMRLRGHLVESWKIVGQTAVIVAFFAGAIAGAFLERRTPGASLLILGTLYVLSGLAWFIAKRLGQALPDSEPHSGPA